MQHITFSVMHGVSGACWFAAIEFFHSMGGRSSNSIQPHGRYIDCVITASAIIISNKHRLIKLGNVFTSMWVVKIWLSRIHCVEQAILVDITERSLLALIPSSCLTPEPYEHRDKTHKYFNQNITNQHILSPLLDKFPNPTYAH